MKKFNRIFVGLILVFALTASLSFAGEITTKDKKRSNEPVQIKVVPWGQNQAAIEAAKLRVERSKTVQSLLNGTRYRLMEFNYIENENKNEPTQIPTRFQAVFYDYTNDRTISAQGDFAGTEEITAREEFYQPTPNDEEFAEAVKVLQKDRNFSELMNKNTFVVFRPMPPVTVLDGTRERLVNVGLDTQGNAAGKNEIVSVSIKNPRVIRYAKGAPEMSLAAETSCGVTNSGQFTTSRGTAGQYQLSITQNGAPLWDMLVFRPAASSGTLASGLEVREVKYKGKSVLKRGHAPVLNVMYPGGKCGPYRDWQWQEDMFQTAPDSTDPAPGIRILPPGQIAQTVVENDNDVGDFKGVAIYTQNGETVLVTEMQAGWYRYMMQWRFADDGTIRPRFGFGSVNSYCVCQLHNHNVYWRFDFDIVNPINKVFQVERARKFLQPITTEVTRLKSFQTNRSIMVQNSSGDEAYMLVPNLSDGIADSFARSDFWILQYKNVPDGTPLENELDDGYYFPDGECTETDGTCININKFINGESLVNKDVVIWYGAHFVHDDAANTLNRSSKVSDHPNSHIVGPDIRPIRW